VCATKDYWDFLKAYSSKWRVGTLGALLPDCLDFAEEFGDATPEELLMPCGIEHLIRWPGMLTLLDSRTCIRITPMALMAASVFFEKRHELIQTILLLYGFSFPGRMPDSTLNENCGFLTSSSLEIAHESLRTRRQREAQKLRTAFALEYGQNVAYQLAQVLDTIVSSDPALSWKSRYDIYAEKSFRRWVSYVRYLYQDLPRFDQAYYP